MRTHSFMGALALAAMLSPTMLAGSAMSPTAPQEIRMMRNEFDAADEAMSELGDVLLRVRRNRGRRGFDGTRGPGMRAHRRWARARASGRVGADRS